MKKREPELAKLVAEWMEEARSADEEEDEEHGPGHAEKRQGPQTKAMRTRLRLGGWRSHYRWRKHTVEPVFGQIKEDRGFRHFLRRGLEHVRGEWALLCTVHNLLKPAAVRSAARA